MKVMQSLKSRAVAEEKEANSAKAWARKTLDKITELWLLSKGLIRTVHRKCKRIACYVDAKLVRPRILLSKHPRTVLILRNLLDCIDLKNFFKSYFICVSFIEKMFCRHLET